MIVKIKNGLVTIEEYGLPPGKYSAHTLGIDDLLRERALLHIQYFEEMTSVKKRKLSDLIEQVSRLIDQKCQEADAKLRNYLGYGKEEEQENE